MLDELRLMLQKVKGFDWDNGNKEKSWSKHQITQQQAEEVFSNSPKLFVYDERHSQKEGRFMVLGKTHIHTRLTIVFTVRKNKIRVISARRMKKGREINRYEEFIKEVSN